MPLSFVTWMPGREPSGRPHSLKSRGSWVFSCRIALVFIAHGGQIRAQRGGHSHALAWEMAGWKTSRVDMVRERVVFARAQNS